MTGQTFARLVDVLAKWKYPLSLQDVLEPTRFFQVL